MLTCICLRVILQAADSVHGEDGTSDGFAFHQRLQLGDRADTADIVLGRSAVPLFNTTSLAETRTRVYRVRFSVGFLNSGSPSHHRSFVHAGVC